MLTKLRLLKKHFLLFTGTLFFAVSLLATAQSSDSIRGDEAINEALQAAQAWLALIDNQQYAQSWDETADFFKSKVSKEKWLTVLNASQQKLGKVLSRSVFTRQYRTTMPGAPAGEYVIIEYRMSFEKDNSAVEKISMVLDSDNTWRVVGYLIK